MAESVNTVMPNFLSEQLKLILVLNHTKLKNTYYQTWRTGKVVIMQVIRGKFNLSISPEKEKERALPDGEIECLGW